MKRMMIRFFGWLFVTRTYIESMDDDEVGRRAFGDKAWRVYKMGQYLDGTAPERLH